VVKRQLQKHKQPSKQQLTPPDPFQAQLQSLVKQHKYRQALDEIQKAKRSQPDLKPTPSEAEIWLMKGKHEFEKSEFRPAEQSFRRSLELGLNGDAHYWLARTLLSLNRLDAAFELLQTAFEQKTLPKNYTISYAKLLLLKGDIAAVKQLIDKQAKLFPAAHLHWLRGVLALKAEQPEVALEAFSKLKQPETVGDRPDIWQIYTQQTLGHWEAAATQLGLNQVDSAPWMMFRDAPRYTNHPVLQRLAFFQQAKTGEPPIDTMLVRPSDQHGKELMDALAVVQLIEKNNPHDAAHALSEFNRHHNRFPELAALRPAVLLAAGQQAMNQGELGCAAQFWQLSLKEQSFNPQVAVNLMKVLDANEDYQELQRLLTQIIRWLEREFKQHPQKWPKDRQAATLSYAHCRLADTWMSLGRGRTALGELQTAERIDPRSPEVIGRRGIVAMMEDRHEEAIQLLTEALEGGARFVEIYQNLIEVLKEQGQSERALEIRRRFGKKFGDLNPELEVAVPAWVDALSSQNYTFFREMVRTQKASDPPLRACRIFIEAAQSEVTPSGKVSVNQTKAVPQWDDLLKGLSTEEQVSTLQAIALCLLLFAKREKGIAALINQYLAKLAELRSKHPAAVEAYLVMLALKERDPKKLQAPLQSYLGSTPQPGNALAQLQLQVRRYGQIIGQNHMLRSAIDEALSREPQNPLLLLAKATTYPSHLRAYEEPKQQGFEIARRLQDAKALQAFRDEQAFLTSKEVQDILPNPENMEDFDLADMDDLLEKMIRKMLGNQVPPSELKRMLPELKQMMLNSMPPDMFGDDDEADFDFGSGFGFPTGGFSPPAGRSSKRKRR
jgi:tetratricopeptide (TPR) repeat protein